MKYLLLIYMDEKKLAATAQGESDVLWRETQGFLATLRQRGICLAAAALGPAVTATVLRRRSSGLLLTDGPFAETKEQLGGFLLIDVAHLDEALQVAAQSPAARIGSVEVRPVRDLEAELKFTS